MYFRSTRKASPLLGFSQAVERGLAPDGGLYVPEYFPRLDLAQLAGCSTAAELAVHTLAPFFEGDVLAPQLEDICHDALDFALPLVDLDENTALLELFHGPTAAFKDVGARFLAQCLTRQEAVTNHTNGPRTVLVATSGDTGGAVAAGFYDKPGIEVVVLFPEGLVSKRQQQQLTCWGGNVRAFAVQGNFDDCQRLVKEAFADDQLRQDLRLTSANSISLGRLLPQMVYHAHAALLYAESHGGQWPILVVPSGNLGDASAAFWAKAMGFPIAGLVLATNSNRAVVDFLEDGVYRPRPSVPTLANAMDVGAPSNIERLLDMYQDVAALRAVASAVAVSDEQIRESIVWAEKTWSQVVCPHTATAVYWRRLHANDGAVLVATAHPAKFETVVEPLLGRKVPMPQALAELMDRPTFVKRLLPELSALRRELQP